MPFASYDATAACSNDPLNIQILGAPGSIRCEWEVLDKPAGSQVIIPDDQFFENDVEVTEDGAYQFRVCCFYEEGVELPPPVTAPEIACPLKVVAGDTANISLIGCQDASIEWSGSGAGFTSITGDENGATVTTDPAQPGIIVINVDCTQFDNDGNPITTPLSCLFQVIAADTELVCATGPQVEVEYVNCGERCECVDFTVVFDCGEEVCSSDSIGIIFKDCTPCEEDENCPELVQINVTGGQAPGLSPCNDLIECCDTSLCCDPHAPLLMWNNLCVCPGWTFDAPAIEGSSFYNACSCNPGQKWWFDGPVTITGSGPNRFIDAFVIFGHNIQNGQVITSPLVPPDGDPVTIGAVSDSACIEGYTMPLVMNFEDSGEVTNISITITPNGPGPFCIDQIFIGQKFFLPDDKLPLNFINPHDGDDYSLEVKESECGILSRSIKHEACDFSLEICADDEWLCEEWRPFLRYARRHGFMFQWSRNRKPTDIISAWLVDKQQGSSANEFGESIVTLKARGYISQPQISTYL